MQERRVARVPEFLRPKPEPPVLRARNRGAPAWERPFDGQLLLPEAPEHPAVPFVATNREALRREGMRVLRQWGPVGSTPGAEEGRAILREAIRELGRGLPWLGRLDLLLDGAIRRALTVAGVAMRALHPKSVSLATYVVTALPQIVQTPDVVGYEARVRRMAAQFCPEVDLGSVK